MEKRPFSPEDLFRLVSFGGARLSPDATEIAYVRQHQDQGSENASTNIFLADVATGTSRRLTTSGKDRSPRWSPDGKRIAFISERSGRPEIWVIDPRGGEAWRLPVKQPVQGEILWSPLGTHIFFASNAFSKPDAWIPYPGAPGSDRQRAVDQALRSLQPKDGKATSDDKKPNDINVITRLLYRMDGTGYFGDMRRHVYAAAVPPSQPAATEQDAQQVTSGDYDHTSPALTPDGKYVLVSALRREDADYHCKSDLWVFEVGAPLAVLLCDAPGPVNGAQWSPDGAFIAFTGHDRARNVSTRTDLYVLPVGAFMESLRKGETPVPLTLKDAYNLTSRLDSDVASFIGADPGHAAEGPVLIWEGSSVYFPLADHGEVFIYRATAGEAGQWHVEKVFGDAGRGLGGYDAQDGVFVYQSSTPSSAEDIFVLKDGQEKRLTSENDGFLLEITLGQWRKFRYQANDGQEVDGWVVYPYAYEIGNKYPLVVMVHGGPHGAYGSSFMFSAQLFASRGYAVAYCNPRGSTSYGQEFMAVIDGDWGNKDYTDVMSCVDALIAMGLADADRMFIHGWSYGGYMVVWTVTQTSRFKAACAGACVSNMHSDYGTTDIMWADEHEYGGTPWEKADLLLGRSALTHVANVTTPILLFHGEKDFRCPVSQSEQFYVALRRLGKTAVFVRYPEEYHSLKRILHRVDRYQRMLAWFDHYRA